MFSDTHVKALMAAILLSTLEPPEDDEDICLLDMAASLAEDLYDHVVSGSHRPPSETTATWMAPPDKPGKGN